MTKKKDEKKVKETSKKEKTYNSFQLGLIIILTVVIFALCIALIVKKVTEYKENKKMVEEFNEYYESDDLSIIFYYATGCDFCELQRPILDQIAKDYDLEYLDIDKTKLTEKQNEDITDKLNIEGATPATVVVQNGEVVLAHVGYVQGNKYVDFFVEAGVLPEGSKYVPEENLTFIGYDEFKELQSSEEPVVAVIGGATCDYCATAKPILSNLVKAYDVPIYYLTLDYITAEERISVVDDLETMEYQEQNFVQTERIGTPALLIIKDNKVIAYQAGLGNIDIYTKLFKDNGVIE